MALSKKWIGLMAFVCLPMMALAQMTDTEAQARAEEMAENAQGACAACAGMMGLIAFLAVAAFVLNIALAIWVARDAKARGMDSAVLWMILFLLTGLLGLIIYLFARPQGNMIQCSHCNNKRLQASAKCPHCGNE